MWRLMSALMLTGLMCVSTNANEPTKKQEPELLPAPKLKIEPSIIVSTHQRTDTREVWQHYGVNAFGRFVPRVIVTTHGAYYSRNLEPYPWPYNRPSAIMP
jgi:hypothetical protein